MGMNTEEVIDAGVVANPSVDFSPLQRSVNGSKIIYTWSYNYTDVVFFVPKVNRSGGKISFEWGFDYNDPGTYVNGSHHIGRQEYIYYKYTLVIDTAAGESTLYQDYKAGKILEMSYRDNYTDPWIGASYPDDHWIPTNWAMALGTWSFIIAGQDYSLTDLEEGEINATTHKTGLTTVKTTLGGTHAFDFKFSQKPKYRITNYTESAPDTHNVLYETLDVKHDAEFINSVSGMTRLVGDFGRLLVAYVINQTNHFTKGIPFEVAYNATDPDEMAAFFVTCYPEYGVYGGGPLDHDPVFTMYFTPASGKAIPGYPITIFSFTLMIGISILLVSKIKERKIK